MQILTTNLHCSIFPFCDPRGKPLAALGAFDLLKVDAADFIRCNRVSALRANRIERRLNFFQIDFRLPGHWGCLPADQNWRLLLREAFQIQLKKSRQDVLIGQVLRPAIGGKDGFV